MTFLLQLVDDNDAILVDFNDHTGANNAYGIGTHVSDVNLDASQGVDSFFEPPSAPGGTRVSARDGLVSRGWRQHLLNTGGTADELRAWAGQMAALLRKGGVLKYQGSPTSEVRYYDFESGSAQGLMRGQNLGAVKLYSQIIDPDGFQIVVTSQPFSRSAELSSDTNKLTNPTLWKDSDGNGMPDGWTDVTGGNTLSIDAATESFQVITPATTTSRIFHQIVTPAAPGEVWTWSLYGSVVSGPGRWEIDLEFLNSSDVKVGSTALGGLNSLAPFTRDEVTATAPANTAKVKAIFYISNSSAASSTVRFRDGQLEKAAAASTFANAPAVVTNDERAYVLDIKGEAETPVKLSIKGGAGSTIQQVVLATRSNGNTVGENLLPDYLNNKVFQLENHADATALATSLAADDIIDTQTAHGFGVDDQVVFTALTGGSGLTVGTTYFVIAASLGATTFKVSTGSGGTAVDFTTNITAGSVQRVSLGRVVADGDASGGQVLQVSGDTTDQSIKRRGRVERTTNLESLRGTWDVWLRTEAAYVPGSLEKEPTYQLRWGASLQDPAPFFGNEITHPRKKTGSTSNYVDLLLGRIYVPEEGDLAGVAMEVWTNCSDTVSEKTNLDFLVLVPTERSSGVVVPYGTRQTRLGKDSTDASGTPTVDGNSKLLDNLDSVKVGYGVLPSGRYRATIRWSSTLASNITLTAENAVTGADAVTITTTATSGPESNKTTSVEWTGDGTTSFQVVVLSGSAGGISVHEFTLDKLPFIGPNETAVTDPEGNVIVKLDASMDVLQELEPGGLLPVRLNPGKHVLYVMYGDVKTGGLYREPNSVLTREATLSYSYAPRWRN